MKPQAKPARCRYNKADDAWLLPLIRELVDYRDLRIQKDLRPA